MFSISCISSSGGMSGVVISDVEGRVSEESELTLLIWTLILSVAVLRPFWLFEKDYIADVEILERGTVRS